jgi:hypothetical protein
VANAATTLSDPTRRTKTPLIINGTITCPINQPKLRPLRPAQVSAFIEFAGIGPPACMMPPTSAESYAFIVGSKN